MYTKTKLFNLTLNMLLLKKEVANSEEDSADARTLRTTWDAALFSTLAKMDLNRTKETKDLELLVNEPNDLWLYAYKYPSNCLRIRRLVSTERKDDESTKIEYETGLYNGQSVIFTDEYQAVIEYIPNDFALSNLNVHGGLAVAAKHAYLAAPLLIGKESIKIRQQLKEDFTIYVLEAQELDSSENLTFDSPALLSPLVRARLE